ncbi:hypothetical protein Csa_010611 [Cucumis sativus]|nr:hypothetical protein Csa_010611 [Cucumis sativus]
MKNDNVDKMMMRDAHRNLEIIWIDYYLLSHSPLSHCLNLLYLIVKGPGCVTAQDIILPPSVEIVDNTQHIANLMEPINLCIELKIERNRGYHIQTPNNFQDASYPMDAIFMPVRNERNILIKRELYT